MGQENIKFIIQARDGFSKAFGKLTRTLGIASAAMGAMATASVVSFAKYESALTDMGKVTSESLESINKKIMGLPAVLGDSTSLVKGYYQVISAGVTDPKKALDTLTVAAMASKAAHVDQSEVIKGLTKMMAGFEGQIESVTEASDLLFAIEKEGQTSFEELIPVIGSLSKISKDLNVESTELAAALAQITQTAGTTSEAATQYKSIMVGLMKPTPALTAAIKNMGFASADAAIEQIGLTETLKGLDASTDGSKIKMGALFGSQEALLGMSALASEGFTKLDAKIKSMGDTSGVTKDAFGEWQGTLEGIWDTFKSTINRLAIQFGEKVAPTIKKALKDITKYLTDNLDNIISFASKTVEVMVSVIGGVVDVGVKAAKDLKKVWDVFNSTIEATKIELLDMGKVLEKAMGPTVTNVFLAAFQDFFGKILEGVEFLQSSLESLELIFIKWVHTLTVTLIKDFQSLWTKMVRVSQWGIDNLKALVTGGDVISIGDFIKDTINPRIQAGMKESELLWSGYNDFVLVQIKGIQVAYRNLFKGPPPTPELTGLEEGLPALSPDVATSEGLAGAGVAPVIPLPDIALVSETFLKLQEENMGLIEGLTEQWEQYYLDDEERVAMQYERFLEDLDIRDESYKNLLDNQKISDEEYQDLKADLDAQGLKQYEIMVKKFGKLDKKAAKEKISSAEETAKKQEALRDKSIRLGIQGLDNFSKAFSSMGRSGFEVSKGLSIASALMTTFLNATKMYKAGAELPPPLNVFMPAVLAASAVAAGMAQVSKIRSTTYSPKAHTGLTEVPREQTYLLDRGERVVSRTQNEDLKEFLDAERAREGSGEMTVNVEVLPNATNAESLLGLSRYDWEEIIADKIIPGMRALKVAGVTI